MILYLNRTSHGGQGTRELRERSITRGLDQAPFVAGETRPDQLSLEPFELGVGGFLIAFHERGIADHVSGQDRRQSPLNPLLCHSALRTTRPTTPVETRSLALCCGPISDDPTFLVPYASANADGQGAGELMSALGQKRKGSQ
jgi:hypothetical protein